MTETVCACVCVCRKQNKGELNKMNAFVPQNQLSALSPTLSQTHTDTFLSAAVLWKSKS